MILIEGDRILQLAQASKLVAGTFQLPSTTPRGALNLVAYHNTWRNIVAYMSHRINESGPRNIVKCKSVAVLIENDAKRFAQAVREYWGIENSLHWIFYIAFREDEGRKRKEHSAENFTMLRRITLNLLKQEKTCKRSIARKRLSAGWDESYLEKVLFQA